MAILDSNSDDCHDMAGGSARPAAVHGDVGGIRPGDDRFVVAVAGSIALGLVAPGAPSGGESGAGRAFHVKHWRRGKYSALENVSRETHS